MTPVWRLVAAREVSTGLRDKAYVGSTVVLGAIVVLGIVLGAVLGGPPDYDVAVTRSPDAALVHSAEQVLRSQGQGRGAHVQATTVAGRSRARAAVREGDVDVALLPTGGGAVLVGRRDVPADLAAAVQTALRRKALAESAAAEGTTVDRLLAGSVLTRRLTSPSDVDQGAADAAAFLMTLLFFVSAIGFGTAIAASVVQEKENRVVEILAAAVPLRPLLWGKVAGNSLLALGQVVLVSVAALSARALTGGGSALPDVGLAAAWFLAFFVVGFLALASLWSIAGSVATRHEDLQATTAPGQALLLLPYLVAVTGSDRAIAVLSYLPIASSMTMPGRVVHGGLPWWQPALSLSVAVLAAVLLVRLGARWYERTLLQTSRRTRYRELLRSR